MKRKSNKTNADIVDNHIAAVLTILNQFVEFKDAILILKPTLMINVSLLKIFIMNCKIFS